MDELLTDDRQLLELNVLLDELKKREEHASTTYVPDDNPKRNQKGFHQSIKWIRLLFGGNRSGKSRSAAQEIFWYFSESHPFQKTPKAPRIWVLSVEYRTIYEGIWSHLKNVIAPWTIERTGPKIPGWDIPTYIESKTGARIDFISAVGGDDTRRKVQAAEIDLLAIDEEIGGELWEELQMRLLTRGGRVIVSATLVQSEDWLLNLEDEAESGSPDVDLFRLDTTLNKHNNQELLQRIYKNLSAEEREVRIYGQRRRSMGLVYNTWNPDEHECDPFPIPKEWTKFMIFDPGWRTQAALWIAIAPDNIKYGYREMYLNNLPLGEAVKFMRAAEGYVLEDGIWRENDDTERMETRIIDPAAFRHLEDGSLGVGYQLATDYNLFFVSGFNEKRTNVEDVRRWLENKEFKLFRTLEHFKKERSKYKLNPDKSKRDKDSTADRPLKKFDHLMNCWEYGASAKVMFRPQVNYQQKIKQLATAKPEELVLPEGRMQRIHLMRERQKLRANAEGSWVD